MNPILDAASSWFFDSATHSLNGALEICLVEGIKGAGRQFVEVDGTSLGPYFPVTVESGSRCVQVAFAGVLAFFVYDESLDRPDLALKKKQGRVLFEAQTSSFRSFVESRTSVLERDDPTAVEFVLCCEDRIFHVLATAEPTVHLLNKAPDLGVDRTQTWSAS